MSRSACFEGVEALTFDCYGTIVDWEPFPVAGTLMIEPTECETREELDRLADADDQCGRWVDNAYGDRNLVCSCPPVEAYVEVV